MNPPVESGSPIALSERLLDLALQRTLPGFEQALKRTLDMPGLHAWACVFPPSFQAGGRPLFIAHGIRPGSALLEQASKQGLESLYNRPEGVDRMLAALAAEIAPESSTRWRVLRVTRERGVELTLFCFRPKGAPDFSREDLELLSNIGGVVDRCFLALADQQQHEFLAGLFRVVSNLHPEGLCIIDNRNRILFENRKFREHMHLWKHGAAALQNLSLPRQTEIPAAWLGACENSFQAFRKVSFPPVSGRMAVTQGPLSSLRVPLSAAQWLEGAVRYLAFQSSLGVRPYLLLTSSTKQHDNVAVGLSLDHVAKTLQFSRRETELAELILKGSSAREIGEQLRISLPTVKTHIRNILRKAGVKTRLQFAGLCRDPEG